MAEDSIRFLHLSDTHFGVHYALKPRNLLRRIYGELFFLKVKKVIQEAISFYNVDFIIHSGDFFNKSKPPPVVVDRGIKFFQLAAKMGIPVFIIPGNHERSKLPLGLLPFSSNNIKIFSEPCSYLFEKKGISIKITGFPYIRYKDCNAFPDILEKAWNNEISYNSNGYDYSILVIHQLIAGSQIENYTFSRGYDVIQKFRVLSKFNYIACGHVHRFQFLYDKGASLLKSVNRYYSVKQDGEACNWYSNDEKHSDNSRFPNPVIAYAGSLERVSIEERNETKGYIIGEVKPSTTGYKTMNLKCQFHELSAVRMIYKIWDLSKSSINDCISQTLEEMYYIYSITKSNRNKFQEVLTGIIRIRIKGKVLHKNIYLNYFKREAKRLGFYLTINNFFIKLNKGNIHRKEVLYFIDH